jgi:hypothetical protein
MGNVITDTNGFDSFIDANAHCGFQPLTDSFGKDPEDVTQAWEMWASNLDKTVYGRLALNFDGLSGDGMFDAFDAPALDTELGFTMHGDTTSVFRSSYDVMNFPTHLVMRFTLPTHNFVFKEGRVKYFDWADTEL